MLYSSSSSALVADVVEDVDRVAGGHLGGAVDEGLAGGVGGPGVGGADAELVVGRVGVGLGGVGPDRGDPGRLEGGGEVGVLLPGQLVGVLHDGRRPARRHGGVHVGHPGRRRGGVRPGVGEGELLLAGTGGGVRARLRSAPSRPWPSGPGWCRRSCCRAGWPSPAWRRCRSRSRARPSVPDTGAR